jgi:hypothetical protein
MENTSQLLSEDAPLRPPPPTPQRAYRHSVYQMLLNNNRPNIPAFSGVNRPGDSHSMFGNMMSNAFYEKEPILNLQ